MSNLVFVSVGNMVMDFLKTQDEKPDEITFFIHQDNTATILVDQRRINRIKLTDREVYDSLNANDNGFYCIEYDVEDGDKMTFIRTTVVALGLNEKDLSQEKNINLGVGSMITIDDYLSQRDKDTAYEPLINTIDALLNVKV